MMSSALNNVVVNPPWNVPRTLARKDILPKLWNDPGYLERHGYTVMRGWNGKETIDQLAGWLTTITASNLPFRFQQAPGARNSLGRYKFQYAEFGRYLSARYAEPQSVPEDAGVKFRLCACE